MPIPAQNPVSSGKPATYDKLLLKIFHFQGGTLRLVLSRYGESGNAAVEQPHGVHIVSVNDVNSDAAAKTLVDGVKTLVSDYNIAKSRVNGVVSYVRVLGTATEAGIGASLELISIGAPRVTITDAYAEAGSDADFAALMAQFLTLVAAYNDSKKVV